MLVLGQVEDVKVAPLRANLDSENNAIFGF